MKPNVKMKEFTTKKEKLTVVLGNKMKNGPFLYFSFSGAQTTEMGCAWLSAIADFTTYNCSQEGKLSNQPQKSTPGEIKALWGTRKVYDSLQPSPLQATPMNSSEPHIASNYKALLNVLNFLPPARNVQLLHYGAA